LKQVRVLADAAEDLEAARDFYDTQEPGVGEYCVDSLLADIESLGLFQRNAARRNTNFPPTVKTQSSGCRHFRPGNRANPRSRVSHSQPSSIARGGVKSVRHKIAPRVSSTAEIHEDFPVSSSRPQKMHLVAGTKIVDEFKCLSQRSRLLEDFRMRDDPQATAQGQSETATLAGSRRADSSQDLISR